MLFRDDIHRTRSIVVDERDVDQLGYLERKAGLQVEVSEPVGNIQRMVGHSDSYLTATNLRVEKLKRSGRLHWRRKRGGR